MPRLLRIPEAASLGLHAAVILASEEDRAVSVPELADRLDASEAHLAKVMQRLAKAGIVNATRGPHGGYRLDRPAESVTLLNVYEAIEGPVEPAACLFRRPVCGRAQCIFGGFLAEFDQRFRDYLAASTLAQLAVPQEASHA